MQKLETDYVMAKQLGLVIGEIMNPNKYKDIETIKTSIEEENNSLIDCLNTAYRKGKESIQHAVNMGILLNKAKELLKHGEFGNWIKENKKQFNNITERTCNKYMALANKNHGSYLSNAQTLREAYIVCGIIKESIIPPIEDKNSPATSALVDSNTPSVNKKYIVSAKQGNGASNMPRQSQSVISDSIIPDEDSDAFDIFESGEDYLKQSFKWGIKKSRKFMKKVWALLLDNGLKENEITSDKVIAQILNKKTPELYSALRIKKKNEQTALDAANADYINPDDIDEEDNEKEVDTTTIPISFIKKEVIEAAISNQDNNSVKKFTADIDNPNSNDNKTGDIVFIIKTLKQRIEMIMIALNDTWEQHKMSVDKNNMSNKEINAIYIELVAPIVDWYNKTVYENTVIKLPDSELTLDIGTEPIEEEKQAVGM